MFYTPVREHNSLRREYTEVMEAAATCSVTLYSFKSGNRFSTTDCLGPSFSNFCFPLPKKQATCWKRLSNHTRKYEYLRS
jgi:hypothetical protein